MGKLVTDYVFYRWRYFLGYGLIGIAILGLILVAALYVPGGISQTEIKSVVDSDHLSALNFTPDMAISLPYHALQKLSLHLLGVSIISIKLPSILLALLSAVGVFLLLRFWFKKNIAVLTTVLVITTGQFLYIAQSGAPGIMYVFWSVWLLTAATMIARHQRSHIFWKIVLFSSAALSLYTALSTYILLALASASILHPHLRYLIRHLSKWKLAVASILALLLITPLIYSVVRDHSIGLRLLGIPSTLPNLAINLRQLTGQYFDFLAPINGALMSPVYGLGSVILIVLGLLRLFTTKYTARSYIVIIWLVLLLPILVINPVYTSITFVPILLLMGTGLEALLRAWYQLFPRNPYARIVGLVPLVIFISGLVLSGVDRYAYGYRYDPRAASNFTRDIQLVNHELQVSSSKPITLIASPAELPFYTVVAKHQPKLVITTAWTNPNQTTLVTRAARGVAPITSVNRIVTDTASQNADRLYIYSQSTK